jgi:Response receiver domain
MSVGISILRSASHQSLPTLQKSRRMIDLSEHYIKGVRRFLQTAIVIDDEAEFVAPTTPAARGAIPRPTGSLIQQAAAVAPSIDDPSTQNPEIGAALQGVEPAEEEAQAPVGLDAKVLSEAFLGKNMICGLYRPARGDNMVERTAGAARLADIVIVDWYLDDRGSRAAKDIILNVLKADAEENGRLRLIAVYTSQPGRVGMAADLLAEIEAEPALRGRLIAKASALVGGDTRIVFLNKRGRTRGDDLDEVSEADLPERLVSEFATLSDGLLATFAISAIAAVRRGAHHVLALYGEDLDGAYVAHRCALPHPDDAVSFAADLISSELRNLIELDDTAERNLKADVVDAWLARLVDSGHTFRTDKAQIPTAEVKKFVVGGSKEVERSAKKHHAHGDAAATGVAEKDRVTCGGLPRVFYASADAAKSSTRLLSRLATFQRERIGRARLPKSWQPTLTLGSVVQIMPVRQLPELLLCMQPRCDSVRLKRRFAFPFQTIDTSSDSFNLALRDLMGADIEAWVKLKPRDSRMLSFEPADASKTVRAVLENDVLVFSDIDGRKYAWLGDLKEMKAQKWAGDLGGRVQGVGLDDFEWLRIASDRGLQKDWT